MKLRYQTRALDQIDRALSYIAARSPQGAAKVEVRLTEVLLLLQRHPHVGVRTRLPGVRRIVLNPYPYLIYYYVGRDEIVIQRFRHGARQPLP